MKNFKKICLVMFVVAITLVGCGGSNNPLVGTWTGQDDFLGAITFEFKSNGSGNYKNAAIDKEITYLIDGTKITVTMFGDPIEYTYNITENKLTLDATDPVAVDYELTKK